MPFLFNMIHAKLKKQPLTAKSPADDDREDSDDETDPVPKTDLQGDGMDPNDEFDVNSPVDHNERAYMPPSQISSLDQASKVTGPKSGAIPMHQ
ncbi:hypothetical protein PTTG_00676 [Puccinia triticina 1-1 BBBD Race 1]|uniref:Uncharacterized protein n=1 Tax=Puccinia triticina (isolate 1-1 / race 1 (BBBD)) TaxID=630390 RepID=A0A180GUB9_PUCT1|nr:hypothetical protein PTTG_00676 [Puccinia triticina 1-1 BBBD Race 1]